MSNAPAKRSQPGSPRKPHADFNWPPTDDELSQYTFGTEAVQTAFDKPHADFTWPPPDEELKAQSVDPPSSEPRYDQLDDPPRDERPTPSDADVSTHSGVWCSTTSAIAGAHSDTSLDGTCAREWTAEIKRLQALLEQLTEPLEWRIPNITAHERRPKP